MKIQLSKSLFLFSFTLLFFASCMPEKNELWVNKDGSGKSVVTMDMGEMASMAMEMTKMMDEDSGDTEDEAPERDIWDKGEKMDTVINFYDTMPDSVKQKLAQPELMKKMNIRMNVDSEKEYAKMFIDMSYDSYEEMKSILKTLKDAQRMKSGGMMAMMAGDDSDLSSIFSPFEVDYDNGIIRLEGFDTEDLKEDPEYAEMLEAMKDPANSEDPEFMAMFQMLIGGDMETVVHAPGKILFTNDMTAVIEGNTVTFTDNMVELIQQEQVSDRIIKYKN